MYSKPRNLLLYQTVITPGTYWEICLSGLEQVLSSFINRIRFDSEIAGHISIGRINSNYENYDTSIKQTKDFIFQKKIILILVAFYK